MISCLIIFVLLVLMLLQLLSSSASTPRCGAIGATVE